MESIIKSIADWIEGQAGQQSDRSGIKAWIYFGLIAGAVILVCAYWYYEKWKIGKEKAQLEHDKDVAEEAKKQELENLQIAANSKDADDALHKINDLRSEIIKIDNELIANDAKLKQKEADINALKNWSDIDAYLAAKNSTGTKPPAP
jgi:hypothetical protein